MVEFSTTKPVESKVMPGVTFVFRVLTEGVRNLLNLTMADDLSAVRDLQADINSLDYPRKDDGTIDDKKALGPRLAADMLKLTDKVDRLQRTRINPAWFKTCYVRVEGLCIDGVDAGTLTADQFIQTAPIPLYEEIVARIRAEAEMSPEERANLDSPITSAAGADGPKSATTAASAEVKDCTSPETA